MARFEIQGMDEIIDQMKSMQLLTGKVAEAMLMAAAEDVRVAWRESAEEHGHRDTGQMIASIGYPRKPTAASDALAIDIYPQGKNTGGVRNAEVAFVLHYGTRKMPGSGWVTDADAKSSPKVTATMAEIWSNYIRTGELPTISRQNAAQERKKARSTKRTTKRR
jgi:hypothetical protein